MTEPIIQLKRNSLNEELANRPEESNVSAHWEVGQTLPFEREMAEQFGLSRICRARRHAHSGGKGPRGH